MGDEICNSRRDLIRGNIEVDGWMSPSPNAG